MKYLFYCDGGGERLLQAFREQLPNTIVYDWQNDKQIPFDQIDAAIVWLPPADFFDNLPNLKHVFALSAGIDSLLDHPGLSHSVAIHRLHDAGMAKQMTEYVLYGVLHSQRCFHDMRILQSERTWDPVLPVKSTEDTQVGLLGVGALGSQVADQLVKIGYPVRCWSRTARKSMPGITAFHGADQLPEFLSGCHVLACLLPLTDSTRNILNKELFELLPRSAYLINPGRGAHLAEQDLLSALDSGQLSGALLDVFRAEPLSSDHAFWNHPRIIVTPHVAAKTQISETVKQTLSSINSIERGEVPEGVVDRARGY